MPTLAQIHKMSGLPDMNLRPLKAALGDELPDISPTPLGRLRLINALRTKFGTTWRQHPTAAQALAHFHGEMHYFSKLRALKGMK